MHATQRDPDQLLALLVDEALISKAMAETLAARVRDSWIPLGKILRQQGSLTMGQLMDLLQEQANSPSMRMGDLAVQLGMCTPADLERALRSQRESSPHVIDLLVLEGHCDPEKLCRVLAHYVRGLEEQVGASTEPAV
ncbi:MAG: hypothetical protein IPJ19_09380 [Planctomycetes bacterium]|nr:hypothetical protein [Planctomycetota bacterium]